MNNKKLKPYMISGAEPVDWAILVFAHNTKEARNLGFPYSCDFDSGEWIEMQSRLLVDSDYLFESADPVKLKADEAHVISDDKLPCCSQCGLWGYKLNEEKICEVCLDI